ncbi:hypothetical protein QJQ45_005030 [Haematococcus lacustris]|nr:hypothetical protein QJQ45_005030 [Haematococcus lacustris]
MVCSRRRAKYVAQIVSPRAAHLHSPSGLTATARKAEAIAKEVQAENALLVTEAQLQLAVEEVLDARVHDLEEKLQHQQAAQRQLRLENEYLEAVVKQQELAMTTTKRAQHRLEAQLRKYQRRPQLTRKQRQQLQILKQTGVSIEVHCKAMSSYYEQHVQMQNALPGLFAALGSSDTTTRWEAAQEVVSHAEMMQQQQEDQQQQQGVEGQQQKRTRQRLPMCDPRVWDAHGTWEKHEKQICAMADMQELSEQDQQQLQSHLEVYYLACPISNAPVESLLQLLKHGTGMFMELPALLELMSMRTHIDAIGGVDVPDFAQRLPELRKEVRREEAAAAMARRIAKAEMKAAAATHRVGQVVVDVGDHEGQHRLSAAYALTYDGRDYSHTTVEEAEKLSVRELQAYLRFHQQELMKGWLKPKLKGLVMAHICNTVAALHGDELGVAASAGVGAAPDLPPPPAAPPWQQQAAGAGAAPDLPPTPAAPPWQQQAAGAGAAPDLLPPPAAPPWQELAAGAVAAPGLPPPPAAPPWQQQAAGAGAAPGLPTPPAEQQGVRAELDTSSTRKRRAGGRDRTQQVEQGNLPPAFISGANDADWRPLIAMAPRTKRSKNASAKMAAQVAAGLAPWTRTAGFIANRLKVLEAELQASQTQHGTDAAASQQREQQLQAQIEELQVCPGILMLSVMACYKLFITVLAIVHELLQYPRPALLRHIHQTYGWSSSSSWRCSSSSWRSSSSSLRSGYSTARYCVEYSLAALRLLVDCNLSFEKVQETIVRTLGLHILPGQQLEDRVPCGMTLRRAMDDICHQAHKHQSGLCAQAGAGAIGFDSKGDNLGIIMQFALPMRYPAPANFPSPTPANPPSPTPANPPSPTITSQPIPARPARVTRDTGILTPAMEQLLSRYYRATHMTNAVPETMLKQLNNDSVLRMNAEGMSGRAKLAMEDTTAWVADGVVTQQGMVAATAERKALQNHGATAIPGTAASTGGTAASPSGTAASPGGTAASPGGTAAIPGGTAASPGGTAASPGGTAASPGGGTQALATNKARLGKRQQQAQSKAERVMKRIRCLVSMPSDEQRATAVAVRDSVTARQQQQQVDSNRLKELEDTARGVYNRFEPPLPALRSKGMTVEELKHLSQKLGVGSVGKNRRQLLERIAEYCKQ